MATTAATFQPGFATANSGSTALTTTGGGALTSMGGMGGGNDSYNAQGGAVSGVQQMMRQPAVRKAMPLIIIALALLLFGLELEALSAGNCFSWRTKPKVHLMEE
jgi:hypothetical protein